MQVLTFNIADKGYAIPLQDIEEIFPMMAIQYLLEAPPFLTGMVNIRCTLLPVIDLTIRLGGSRLQPPVSEADGVLSPYSDRCHLLLCSQHVPMAVIVDGVQNIKEIDESLIQAQATRTPAACLDGIFMENQKIIQLLALKTLLNSTELQQLTHGIVTQEIVTQGMARKGD